jgi:hypothetical protein
MTNITNLQFILDNKPQNLIHDIKDFTPSGINIQPQAIPTNRHQQQQENKAPWRHQDVSRRPANQLTIIKMQ